jgi:8-oxo-dGTP pyrophosphatase MutT (NUDIX family)
MGKQELGETVTQCAVRETAEETGVTIEVTGPLGIYSDPGHVVYYDSDGETRQEFEIILLGRPVVHRRRAEPARHPPHTEWRQLRNWLEAIELDLGIAVYPLRDKPTGD